MSLTDEVSALEAIGGENVQQAFDLLLREMREVMDRVNRRGAEAFQSADYKTVDESRRIGEGLTEAYERTSQLQGDWIDVESGRMRSQKTSIRGAAPPRTRPFLGRSDSHVRTPLAAYFVPILTALVDAGGRGSTHDIIEAVRLLMKDQLLSGDFEALSSDRRTPKWRHATQLARSSLVKLGRVRSDSPAGVWEISEEGRRWLQHER